jgi:hypothetical protein
MDILIVHDAAYTTAVIPAQAGIQTINNAPTKWDNNQQIFVRYAKLYYKLDSGLRRNDGEAHGPCPV